MRHYKVKICASETIRGICSRFDLGEKEENVLNIRLFSKTGVVEKCTGHFLYMHDLCVPKCLDLHKAFDLSIKLCDDNEAFIPIGAFTNVIIIELSTTHPVHYEYDNIFYYGWIKALANNSELGKCLD